MKTIINKPGFQKALRHVSEHHFSTPYSISPMVDRWFNQLAMVVHKNGRIRHLSGDYAREHVDIILDGLVIPKADIENVFRFQSKHAKFDEELEAIEKKILVCKEALNHESDVPLEDREAQLESAKQEKISFLKDKDRAQQLYEDIVDRGQSSINIESIETRHKSPVVNIVHRPNHGLTHAARVGYLITALHTYRGQHGIASPLIQERELEKLQLQMIFSVVGRKDETGFNDGVYSATTCLDS
jgi:hypothetical protein